MYHSSARSKPIMLRIETDRIRKPPFSDPHAYPIRVLFLYKTELSCKENGISIRARLIRRGAIDDVLTSRIKPLK